MQTEETDGGNKWQGVKKLQREARLLLNQAKQRLGKDSHLYQTVGSTYFLLEDLWKKNLHSMPKNRTQIEAEQVEQLLKNFLETAIK